MIFWCIGIECWFGGVVVVMGVDFEVKLGEIFGLVGLNGSGKMMFINVIIGFYLLNEGVVWLLGKDIIGIVLYKVVKFGVV